MLGISTRQKHLILNDQYTRSGFSGGPQKDKSMLLPPYPVQGHMNVTSSGRGVFANVIKLRVWRWDCHGLSGWAINPMTTVHIRRHMHRGEAIWSQRLTLEFCSHKPRKAWSCQKLEKARTEPLAGNVAQRKPWFQFLASRTMRKSSE